MESNRSVDVFGVRMCVIELDSACRTAALVAVKTKSPWVIVLGRMGTGRTLEPPHFLPN